MVSIIIPAYNEAESIGAQVQGIRALYPEAEIIVVNDGSTDETAEIAFRAGADVYSHPYNIGNGAAVKSGIRAATGDILFFWMATASMTIGNSEIARIFPAIRYGRRRARQRQSGIHRPRFRQPLFNWLGSYVSKFPIQDLTSGFRRSKPIWPEVLSTCCRTPIRTRLPLPWGVAVRPAGQVHSHRGRHANEVAAG